VADGGVDFLVAATLDRDHADADTGVHRRTKPGELMKNIILAGLAMTAVVGTASAQLTWIEPVAGYARVKAESDAGDTTADGAAFGLRGRVQVEGIWFVSGEVQHAPLSGDESGVDFDFDYTLYRIGIGAQNDIGEGGANASVKAEYLRLETDLESGGMSADDSQSGGSFTLRFERNLEVGAVILPYAEVAYIGLSDFNGVEANIGFQLPLRGPIRPFIEYRYIDLSGDDDVDYVSSNVQAGVRWTFR
jgi:hypothetical protein